MADEKCPERQNKFLLFLNNNEVFVWDTDAVLTLRRKYRIIGSLVGSLPSNPRQNLVFSLPLVLQAEEVKLLLEKNIARLVVNDSANSPPSQDTVKRFEEERKANIDQQIEKLKEIKKQKLEEFAEVIEEARERKREHFHNFKRKILSDSEEDAAKKQRCTEESEHDHTEDDGGQRKIVSDGSSLPNKWERTIDKLDTSSGNTSQGTITKKQCSSEESEHSHTEDDEAQAMIVSSGRCPQNILEKPIDKDSSASLDNTTASSDNASASAHKDISSGNTIQDNLQDATLVCVTSQQLPSLLATRDTKWTFPATETERLRYKVFVDLWEKGYYITQGSKFGGDYLVYPGDPFRFHSYFVVTIVPWKKSIHSLDLVSVGRLGSTVKKTSVLASVDCAGNVIYTSIQWPGFV